MNAHSEGGIYRVNAEPCLPAEDRKELYGCFNGTPTQAGFLQVPLKVSLTVTDGRCERGREEVGEMPCVYILYISKPICNAHRVCITPPMLFIKSGAALIASCSAPLKLLSPPTQISALTFTRC